MNNTLQSKRQIKQEFCFSIIDRLLDSEPDRPEDRISNEPFQVEKLRDFICRDVEALLNTRHAQFKPPAHLHELTNSVLTYGVDSFISANLITDEAKLTLAGRLQHSIARIEPRLKDINITIFNDRNTEQRILRMRIEARFSLREQPQVVCFDTKLHYSSQQFTVEVSDE